MEAQLINEELLSKLHEKAAREERLRIGFDLRTTPEDSSQRMLNVMEIGTHVPIHRHLNTSETVVCLEGCLDWVFFSEQSDVGEHYEQKASMDEGAPISEREIAADESCFVETARFRLCPREGLYGIQVPIGVWHSVVLYEPSTILEAKDGKYEARK